MDASRFKRRETQTRRHVPELLLGSSDIVPRAVQSRLKNTLSGSTVEPASAPSQAPQSTLMQVAPSRQLRPRSMEFVQPTRKTPAVIPPLAKSVEPIAVASVEPDEPEAVVTDVQEIIAPQLPPIDMALPGENSPLRGVKTLIRTSRSKTIRRWAFRSVAAALIIGIGVGGLLFSQGYIKLHKVFKGSAVTAVALKTNVDPSLLKGEGDGRVNVLLMGRGGGDHDGPDLTDTMMLASIDPVNHTTTLISIPRDLWVDIPDQGAMKINAAWETGEFKYLGKIAPGSTDPQAIEAGYTEVDQTIESVFGVTIDYNALVDFQAFQQAVDTVGGVTVTVPTDLVDPTMEWQNGYNPVLAKAGVDTFDGGQALNYVRSRETTSDFARSQRQRAVLVALKGKVDTLGTLSNPLKIAGLLDAFGNNVQTDLSLSDASRLYSILKGVSNTSITSVGLADEPNHYITTGDMNGQSIDLPTAGLFNYNDIQTFIRSQLKDPYLIKENAKVLVLNGTETPGLATTKADELKSYGYNVVNVADAPTNGWTQTQVIDLSNGKDKYTAHYLEQRFNVTATTTLPDTTIQANGADFVIIVGSDEATTQ
jgi:LCP family protein required for cell wall assembly